MLKNSIKISFRTLKKNPGFTAINVLGLALGLAAFLLIVFYVLDELSYDRYNIKANRIYRVNSDLKFGGSSGSFAVSAAPLATALTNNFPEVEKVARIFHDKGVRVKKGNENIQEDKVVYSDPAIFDIFTLPMVVGNSKNALSEPNTVVITESTAKRYFNSINVIGKTLSFNNNSLYKITGVIHDIPQQSHFNFDFFLSMASLPESKSTIWYTISFNTYLLLKPNADYHDLEAKFPELIKKGFGNSYDGFVKSGSYFRMNLTPLKDIHLHSNRQYELGVNSSLQYVYIFSAIAFFIILIACINFINLTTARSANRAREVGVRKVLGSTRRFLITQFLTESVLIVLIATLIAFFAAWALLPAFNYLADKELAITSKTLIWLLPVLTGIVIVVGTIAGAYPAFFLSGFKPVEVLKGKLTAGFKNTWLRSSLVVFQFSISVFLIISTLIIYKQLNFIQNKNLGFNRNQVLVIKNAGVLGNQAKILKQEIKQLPGVADATLSSFLPTRSSRNPNTIFPNKTADAATALMTEMWSVDADYLPTMGMKMVTGRNFSDQLLTDSSGILINETAAKMLGFTNPLDKKLFNPNDVQVHSIKEYRVIGVVKDFNFSSLRDNISPVVMILGKDNGALSVRVNSAHIKELVNQIENKWKALSPDQHFDYSFMDEDFDATYLSEQRIGKIFIVFTSLAIIIGCLGLFGLAAFAAEQRTKEIGIRKVLGASVTGIVQLLSADFLKLVFIAIVIASPLAFFIMQKWLQDFAYRINMSWWIFALAGAGSIVIALATVSFQAIKAALANPVKSLRSE